MPPTRRNRITKPTRRPRVAGSRLRPHGAERQAGARGIGTAPAPQYDPGLEPTRTNGVPSTSGTDDTAPHEGSSVVAERASGVAESAAGVAERASGVVQSASGDVGHASGADERDLGAVETRDVPAEFDDTPAEPAEQRGPSASAASTSGSGAADKWGDGGPEAWVIPADNEELLATLRGANIADEIANEDPGPTGAGSEPHDSGTSGAGAGSSGAGARSEAAGARPEAAEGRAEGAEAAADERVPEEAAAFPGTASTAGSGKDTARNGRRRAQGNIKETPGGTDSAAGKRQGRPTGIRDVPQLRLAAALLLLFAILTGLAVWFRGEAEHLRSGAAQNRALVDSSATSELLGQLTSAVETVFSYNFNDTAKTEKAAHELLTGNAVDQYNRLYAQVKELAPEQKVVLTTRVRTAGVQVLDGDRAVVLVFADQRWTRADSSGEAQPPGAAQLAVHAERHDERWLISDIRTY
ncbi:hypothetical protein GCM10012275_23710 [Longimycelium tulufanense]|uniref:Mce-associated membrane protein n=1 Tax=Longimycelium tulufanense TaxID=907463 RepID=A0A8J3CC72_9PSEU|nr:hypothetical protein [Longimycelium tulufanense]GGM52048.1 hypothetical protein GCM10012275_23710 [Longimycelium tulufanense]